MQGLVKLIHSQSSGNLLQVLPQPVMMMKSHNTAHAGMTTVPQSASKDGLDEMASAIPLSIGGEDVLDHEGEIFFVGEDPSEDGESPTSSTGPGNGEVGPLTSPLIV